MPLKFNIRCRICGKRIRRTKNVPFDERMRKLRRHYKKYHPEAFREMYRKAAETRRRKKERKELGEGAHTLTKEEAALAASGLLAAYATKDIGLATKVILRLVENIRD